MKRRHRIPREAYFVSDAITPEYQAEIDATMSRAATREAAAQRRLRAAEARLLKAQCIKAKPQRVRALEVARELVELRRQELLTVQRQMSSTPSSAAHRGRGHGKRPVPGQALL